MAGWSPLRGRAHGDEGRAPRQREGFWVDFVSPVEFDYLAAEIRYGHPIVCPIRCERPDGGLEVDVLHETVEPERMVTFPFDEFLALMQAVGEEVKALRQQADAPG